MLARKKLKEKGYKQIGTLGGGNHFIEIGESVHDGKLCIIIHSWTRGFGHGVAEYYMKLASAQYAAPFNDGEFLKKFKENNLQLFKYNTNGYDKKCAKKYVCRFSTYGTDPDKPA